MGPKYRIDILTDYLYDFRMLSCFRSTMPMYRHPINASRKITLILKLVFALAITDSRTTV